ncbi:flagellin [Neorhizobium sp. T25_27]|uniref:flagellin N-terminal helical domain-containing protein n=1 Tax=Neorhizobium sp. T25_27 TaxID=2093831 RepID=UPI000CF9900D|nr:flagellin [Neorhizobium sp. T25_27]
MTSLLTNASAISALQTLRHIAGNMVETQRQVSTGLRVASASDNAAYWSIATTMRSDNGALSAVKDAIGLGAAKVDTAYAAMESSIDVVAEIKNKLVAASESGVDRGKIQEEISQLQSQLKSIASSASFSGENWLQADISGKFDAASRGYVAGDAQQKQIVGAFNRDTSGNVAVRTIDVELDETNVLIDLTGNHGGILDQGILVGARNSGIQSFWANPAQDLYVRTFELSPTWIRDETNPEVYFDPIAPLHPYILFEGAYVHAWPNFPASHEQSPVVETSTEAAIGATHYANEISVLTLDITKMQENKTTLRLGTYASDDQVIASLVPFVDRQLEKMVNAAAKLGSVSMRIELQQEYVSRLTDTIDRGVGRLVDADMNEASTRLKALQTQQQLATQSLSIANAAADSIVTLFR